jgi:Right handed beta helix region
MQRSTVITCCFVISTAVAQVPCDVVVGQQSKAHEFHVANSGNDGNAGTKQKPFASFERAKQAVREYRVKNPHQSVAVTFQSGRYELEKPLKFDAADSGSSSANPVIYQAAQDADVEISGGHLIEGWQLDTLRPGVWKVKAATPSKSKWRFDQLWVNGRQAIRARTPNWWHFNKLASVTETPTQSPHRVQHTFSVSLNDLKPLQGLDEAELSKVQVMVFHKWDTTRETLRTIDLDKGTFETHGTAMQSWNAMTSNCLYYFENFLAALDGPGEFFLDGDGWLYYMPREGEDMQKAKAVAPRIDRLIDILGKPNDPKMLVQNIRFEGLNFRHAEYAIPLQGVPPHQAAMASDAVAINVGGGRDILFYRCSIENVGTTAIWFRKGSQNCRVERCRMFELGISGVRIGEQELLPEPERTGRITIHNCIIQSGGRILPCAVGVWIGHSPDNSITHCDIGDFFYTAVSVGWHWGYGESGAKRNKIEYNHLHHIGYRILSDMGGVYTLGPSEGTRISHNIVHDIYSTSYGGWGLYPDEGSTGILFESNLVFNVKDGGFHQHYGRENIVRNNIFAFSEEGQIAITRAEPHLSFTFEHNIVYFDQGRLLGYNGWKGGAKIEMRHNLYWRNGGQPFDFDGKSFAQWQTSGRDAGSVVADPLFVDAQRLDFRLQKDSPALKIGFKPFDFHRAGVIGNEAWVRLATSMTFPKPIVP